jgi:hypothetical protein
LMIATLAVVPLLVVLAKTRYRGDQTSVEL